MEFMDIPNDLCNFVDMLEICDTGLDSIQCSFDGLWLFAGYIWSMAFPLFVEETVVEEIVQHFLV